MSNLPNSPGTLLQGLSAFWQRFFADKELLSTLYKGTEQQLGQAYLETLESVMSASLADAPLLHRDYWRLLVLRSDLTDFDGSSYVYDLPGYLADYKVIQNSVLAPSAVLEIQRDFTLGTIDGLPKMYTATDLFARPGFAKRTVAINQYPKFDGADVTLGSTPVSLSSDGFVWQATLNDFPDTLPPYLNNSNWELALVSSGGTVAGRILSVSGQVVTLISSTSLAGLKPTEWAVFTGTTATEISAWIPDALSDAYDVYAKYGALVGRMDASTESYRNLLKAIFSYYMQGPALPRIEAALNVVEGFPVSEVEGEVVVSVNGDALTTNHKTYYLPTGTLKDFTVGQVLPAFSSLSTVFRVVDDHLDPMWWWNIVIPAAMMPDDSVERRTVTPELQECVCSDPSTIACGDPGLMAGADDTGFRPTGRAPLRHTTAFQFMDLAFKRHLIGILVDYTKLPGNAMQPTTLSKVILPAKPAYAFLYVSPPPSNGE
jgi:hypothetical protein